MDRWRAAGALLALAACFACSAAAPTASNHTALDLYEGAPEGCYYNFQHYGEGDRIMTNEPCLNCTCHNRMLMCYLRVCPFTKAIGQDCTVEKRADQCCPIVTCPDVPVDLLTSTSTTSPAEYGATGLGKLDKYGCSINGKYFPEGSKVPPTPNKPCEHCYCIRNMTTCVMQECTLHVDGCTPIYHKDVCCPVRYSCDHPEDELPALDDMSTTVRPTPGFLLTTTTISPVTQMTQDCVHEDQIFSDGASIKTEKACEHCYCMKGDIVCVVQECGAPMENEGKNCTSLPPREGQCCPDTYICEGDELSSDLPTDFTTEAYTEKITTLAPPRRGGVEGSGYRNEPDEGLITETPNIEPEVEGSGEEQDTSKPGEEIMPGEEDGEQYISVTTKSPAYEEKPVTTDINKIFVPDETVPETSDEPHLPSTDSSIKEPFTTSDIKDYTRTTSSSEIPESFTTEYGATTTIPVVETEKQTDKPYEHVPTTAPIQEETESSLPTSSEESKMTSSANEYTTSRSSTTAEIEAVTSTDTSKLTSEAITEKEYSDTDSILSTTSSVEVAESEKPIEDDQESSKPQFVPTTSMPMEHEEKLTTEPDHALNTVAVAEEDTPYPHLHIQTTTISLPTEDEERATDKIDKGDILVPHDHKITPASAIEGNEFTTMEPDKGLNTIPSENNEETSSEPSLLDKTTSAVETKATESSDKTDEPQSQDIDAKQTTVAETVTLQPETIATRGDQYTITTEPSFRKEDEAPISTEKTKDNELTTIKSEFVDEGLIPTSEHDHKFEMSSNIPPTDEELTTSIPEYTKVVDEVIEENQITTESALETSTAFESSSMKIPQGEGEHTTEKVTDITTVIPEEPARIPGEGDCLLNGITYRNNSVVPSTNNCHTGCRCASSIIKCDPIICSPPPDYMVNCQSIYDSPDSCCPTYVCDHPKETVPPQSDNQMSGTDSPLSSPTIECRGDQCEITEPTKLPMDTGRPDVECGPEGCGYDLHKPDIQLPEYVPQKPETEECIDGKCKPEDCVNGDCQLTPTEGQVSPVKPCNGELCEKEGVTTPSLPPPLCDNEEDCKAIAIPDIQTTLCEGESCKKIDCGNKGCDSNVISTPQVTEHVPCSGDGCKSDDSSVPECTGDEPCRRKEIVPTECKGSDCVSGIEPTPTKDLTENEIIAEGDKTTELPDIQRTTVETAPEKDTTDISVLEESQTGKPDVIKETTDRPVVGVEGTVKPTSVEEKETEGPILIDNEDNVTPVSAEEVKTEKPVSEGEMTPIVEENKDIEKPASPDEEEKEKPVVTDEGTESPIPSSDNQVKPNIDEEKDLDKPSTTEVEEEKPVISEEATKKPATDDDGVIKLDEEKESNKPAMTDEDKKEKPGVTEGPTEKPSGEEVEPKPTDNGDSDKPAPSDKGEEKPAIEKEEPEKPVVVDEDVKYTVVGDDITESTAAVDIEGTEKPLYVDHDDKEKATVIQEEGTEAGITEEATEKPAVTNEDEKEKPAVDKELGTEEPITVDEDNKEKPNKPEEKPVDIEREGTELPAKTGEVIVTPADKEEESTEKPAAVEEGTDRPVTNVGDVKEKPSAEGEAMATTSAIELGQTMYPLDVEQTEKPSYEEVGSDKPTITEEYDTQTPVAVADEEGKDKLTEKDQENTSKPVTDEQSTEKTVLVDEDVKDKPIVDEKPSSESPSLTEEPKEKPVKTEDEQKEKPDITLEQGTDKPTLVDEEEKGKPSAGEEESSESPITDEKDKEKPITSTEVQTEKPDPEKGSTEQPEVKVTEAPESIDHSDKQKPADIDQESTEKSTITDESPETTIDVENKPVTVEETTEKLDTIIREGTVKPGFEEDKYTHKPDIVDNEQKIGLVDEVSTDTTPTVEDENTEKSTLIDGENETSTPILIDAGDKTKPDHKEEDIKKPGFVEEIDTEKPVEETSVIIDEDFTGKPAVIDETTTKEEEGSGTEIPDMHVTEIEKVSTLPDILIKPTESSMLESEEHVPIDESQTTTAKDLYAYSTEPSAIDMSASSPTSESPAITESQDDDSKAPVVTDHSQIPEITTVPLAEEELITKSPAIISGDVTTSVPEEEINTEPTIQGTSPNINIKDESSSEEPAVDETTTRTKGPELPETTESGESVTKSSEPGEVSEPEVHTDSNITKEEPSVTEAPEIDLRGQETVKPEQPTSEQESTTKVYEENKPIPDSHVTDESKDQTISPVHEHTSALPEQEGTTDQVTEAPITHEDKHKTELPESNDSETGKMSTELPVQVNEEQKTVHPEVNPPGKDEFMTESPVYSTIEPIRSFTEIEDSSVTGQQDVATEYPESSTEAILEKSTTSEQPLQPEIGSPELPEPSPVTVVPIEEQKEQQNTEKPDTDKEKLDTDLSHTTDIPLPKVTEPEVITEMPIKDMTSHEEKSTRIPDLEDKTETSTDLPHHFTPSEDHSKAPDSDTTEHNINEVQETSTKSVELEITVTQPVTSDISRTSEMVEAETKSPDVMYTESHDFDTQEPSITESPKLSTEIPTSSEDVHTETPYKQVTSDLPQSLVTGYHETQTTDSSVLEKESKVPETYTTEFHEVTKAPEVPVSEPEIHTEGPYQVTGTIDHVTKETQPQITKEEEEDKLTKIPISVTEKQDEMPTTTTLEQVTDKSIDKQEPGVTTIKHDEEVMKSTEHPSHEISETTPYLIELEEHTHKIIEDITTISPSEEEHTDKPLEDASTSSPADEYHTSKPVEHLSTVPSLDERTTLQPETEDEPQISELTTKKITDEIIETSTKQAEVTDKTEIESERITEPTVSVERTTTPAVQELDHKEEYATSEPAQITEKAPITESGIVVATEKETSGTEKPVHSIDSHETAAPEDEFTTKATTLRQDEDVSDDKFAKPEEKPVTGELPSPSTTTEIPKPSAPDMQPTDEISPPEDDGNFPPSGTTGYGEPDYVEEDQAFGPGTCRYGGKVYVSAQQIPRDDPCDFCFCFRSDIICLQQSCPPPIHGCHEEPIQGFCCPRYECPVSMATTVNVTTTTTTTTTTLPPHFPTHSYKGAAQRRGCQIKGHTYKVGEVVRSSSGPCLHCTCGGDGQMKCDPKACTPEPMLRQMIAAAVSAKRRR